MSALFLLPGCSPVSELYIDNLIQRAKSAQIAADQRGYYARTKKPLTFSVLLVYDYNIILSLYRFPVILCQQSRKPGSNRENSSLIICRFFDILKKYIDIYRYPFSSGSGWRAKVARRSTGDYRGQPSHLP